MLLTLLGRHPNDVRMNLQAHWRRPSAPRSATAGCAGRDRSRTCPPDRPTARPPAGGRRPPRRRGVAFGVISGTTAGVLEIGHAVFEPSMSSPKTPAPRRPQARARSSSPWAPRQWHGGGGADAGRRAAGEGVLRRQEDREAARRRSACARATRTPGPQARGVHQGDARRGPIPRRGSVLRARGRALSRGAAARSRRRRSAGTAPGCRTRTARRTGRPRRRCSSHAPGTRRAASRRGRWRR